MPGLSLPGNAGTEAVKIGRRPRLLQRLPGRPAANGTLAVKGQNDLTELVDTKTDDSYDVAGVWWESGCANMGRVSCIGCADWSNACRAKTRRRPCNLGVSPNPAARGFLTDDSATARRLSLWRGGTGGGCLSRAQIQGIFARRTRQGSASCTFPEYPNVTPATFRSGTILIHPPRLGGNERPRAFSGKIRATGDGAVHGVHILREFRDASSARPPIATDRTRCGEGGVHRGECVSSHALPSEPLRGICRESDLRRHAGGALLSPFPSAGDSHRPGHSRIAG